MISSHVGIPFLCLIVGSFFLVLLLSPVSLLILLSSFFVYASDFVPLLATTLVMRTAIFGTLV